MINVSITVATHLLRILKLVLFVLVRFIVLIVNNTMEVRRERSVFDAVKEKSKVNNVLSRKSTLLKLRHQQLTDTDKSHTTQEHTGSAMLARMKKNKERPKIRKYKSFDDRKSEMKFRDVKLRILISVATDLILSNLLEIRESQSLHFVFCFMKPKLVSPIIKNFPNKQKMLAVLENIGEKVYKQKNGWFSTTSEERIMESLKGQSINQRLHKLFFDIRIDNSCLVAGLFLLDELLRNVFELSKKNATILIRVYYLLLHGSLLLASKYVEDHSLWNFEFLQLFPEFEAGDLLEVERILMSFFDWKINIPSEEFHFRSSFLEKLSQIR